MLSVTLLEIKNNNLFIWNRCVEKGETWKTCRAGGRQHLVWVTMETHNFKDFLILKIEISLFWPVLLTEPLQLSMFTTCHWHNMLSSRPRSLIPPQALCCLKTLLQSSIIILGPDRSATFHLFLFFFLSSSSFSCFVCLLKMSTLYTTDIISF